VNVVECANLLRFFDLLLVLTDPMKVLEVLGGFPGRV
jgi:hypothetical protein